MVSSRLTYMTHMRSISVLILLLISADVFALSPQQERLHQWFLSDEPSPDSVDHVNEGQLRFLVEPPEKAVLEVKSKLNISSDSIETGWVKFHTCYNNLDPVGIAEIVFRYRELKFLSVQSAAGIGSYREQGNSIQIEDVEHGARLCVSGQANMLSRVEERYFIKNGPFMRKFLDGYYPMKLSLELKFPGELLTLVSLEPVKQPGLSVQTSLGRVILGGWFEGQLSIEAEFGRADRKRKQATGHRLP